MNKPLAMCFTMTGRFACVDFSQSSRDFRRIALEPGYPLLDRSGVNTRIISKWLGRLAAEPECHADSVDWFVRSEQGARLNDVDCHPAMDRDLRGPLKGELKTLKEQFNQAKPKSRTEQAVHRALAQNLKSATSGLGVADRGSYFFKYRDDQGKWRLLWAWGYQCVDEKDARTVICGNKDCQSLFLLRPDAERKCPACGTRIPEQPSVWKRIAVVLLLVMLIAGGAYGAYWYSLPRAVLTGVVVWAGDDQPIHGAEIRIADTRLATHTDEAGRFVLDRIPGGAAHIKVSAPGFHLYEIDQDLVAGQETSIRVALTGDAVLTGLIVNALSDVPLPRAEIRIPGTDLTGQSDEAGRFRLGGLRSGSIEFRVSADGFPSQQLETKLTASQETEVKVALTGRAVLVGQVLDATNEKPIAGAKVSILKAGQSAQTDEKGWFVLKQAPAGSAVIEVTADGFAAERVDKILAGDQERSIRVKMRGAAILTGTVITAADKKPIAGAEIRIAETRFSAQTGQDGRFSLPGIRSGAATIEISAKGFRTAQVDRMLHTGQETSISVSLEGGAVLVGTVIDSTTGKPLPMAEVQIAGSQQMARTDQTGKFRIDGVRNGPANVKIRATGFLAQEVNKELPAGEETTIRVELKGDATITGTVVDSVTNTSIGGAEVRIAGTSLSAKSDEQGRFRVEGPRSGSAEIQVSANGYPHEVLKVELQPGKTTAVDVKLTGDAVLTGQVVSLGSKKPVVGAVVRIPGTKREVQTGDDGRFRFEKMRSGRVMFEVSADGYQSRQVKEELAAGKQSHVEVVLGGNAVLSGEVYDTATEQRIAGADISIVGTLLTTKTDQTGRFKLEGAFGGTAQINVSATGFPAKMVKQELLPGKEAKIRTGLTGTAKITGTVVTKDGQPIPGATVRIAGTSHSCKTEKNGTFRLEQCRAGPTMIEVAAGNFSTQTVNEKLAPGKSTPIGSVTLTSNISLSGKIINAINEQPIADATVSIEGTGNSAKSDASGSFRLESVPPRSLQIQIAADGYFPETVSVNAMTAPRPLHAVLSPMLSPGEIRFVLTWGNAVPDLDIHLYYRRRPGGKRFHVSHKQRKVQNVALDVDNRNGRGPETITIKKAIPGHYEIVVHAYQDPKDARQNKVTLDRSNAEVKLYRYGVKKPQHFRVSTGTDARFPVWHVGAIEVADTGETQVIKYGRFNYKDKLPDE